VLDFKFLQWTQIYWDVMLCCWVSSSGISQDCSAFNFRSKQD